MKHSRLLILTFLIQLLPLVAYCQEQGPEPIITAGVSYWSRYIRRGYDLNRGLPVLEPSLTIALPLSLSCEASGLMGVSQKNVGEVDLTLSCDQTLWGEWLHWSLAFCSYQYLGSPELGNFAPGTTYANSQELIGSLWTQDLPVDVAVEVGRGLGGKNGDDIRGNYASVVVEKEVGLGPIKIQPGLSATYLDEYGIPDRITELAARNNFILDLGTFTLIPSLSYLYLPLPRLLNSNDDDRIFVFGITVSTGW